MSASKESVTKKAQELKNRTDAAIDKIKELSVDDMEKVSGGYGQCTYQSIYACASVQCDSHYNFDCKDFYKGMH